MAVERPNRYLTATAFRVALEARLNSRSAAEGIDLNRLRRQVAFDRLLARLFNDPHASWLLKGGYAMELRQKNARSTKDIDISLPNFEGLERERILTHLQNSAAMDLGDFFIFAIASPQMELIAAPHGGTRHPVTASLAGRTFARFHLDVGMGDIVTPPTEIIEAQDWLGFAGITRPCFVAISKEQQFAEKLHAYTTPRESAANTRVKDLVDMILLIKMKAMDKAILREAIQNTFALRRTHQRPSPFPEAPATWNTTFSVMLGECQLEMSLADAVISVRSYLADV